MLRIDGSYGEGGGQIVRTALTLSCITQTPFEIYNIRAGRRKAGLRPQHLACIKAAQDITQADVEGAQVGAESFRFTPRSKPIPGQYDWQINSAGSTVLVLQTVLLPLAMAAGASQVTIGGGTHVPYSPSAHYLRDVYVPLLIQSGIEVFVAIDRYGWNPKGGGQISAMIEGWAQPNGQDLLVRGTTERIFGYAVATNLPAHIPQRMMTQALQLLDLPDTPIDIRPVRDNSSKSKGTGLFLAVEYSNGRAGFSRIGELGLSSEDVAREAIYEFQVFDATPASVDAYLADQLVLVFALANGVSQYLTPTITEHLKTNVWVIQKFLKRNISLDYHLGQVKVAKEET